MSGDLISRSALKEFLVKARNKAGEEKIKAVIQENKEGFLCADAMMSAFEIVLRILYTQPTAYDVDKVVEQLEELKNESNMLTAKCSANILAVGALMKAIEIVKAGGVE